MSDKDVEKLLLFCLAAVFHSVRQVNAPRDISIAFDQAETFMLEARKRSLLPEVK